MKIQNSYIQNLNISKNVNKTENKKSEKLSFSQYALPSTHTNGISTINSSMPISYTKIGEIPVPGVKEPASFFKLANGQKVVILPKKGPTYVKTTYNVGSLNETENIRGMSHYIEHNLFNGSKNLAPKEYDKRVADLGGITNASTGFSATDYFLGIQLLKDNSLEEAIRINALQTQFPTFPPEQLEKEKEAVKSEIDVYKDEPEDIAMSNVLKNLFGIQTNSTNFILGTKDNINSFNQEKVLDYYNTWYTPDNAVTVITGDVDVNETINIVSKHYNKPADYSKINKRHNEPLTYLDKTIRTDMIMPNLSGSIITMGFAIPEGTTQQDIDKIDVLLSLLMSSESRLSKALDKHGIDVNFMTDKMQNKPNGARAIIASAYSSEEKTEEILKIIFEELNYIANNPPSINEVENSKTKQIRRIKNCSEESYNINSVLTSMVLENNYGFFSTSINNIQQITPQDISETARKFLDLNKTAICIAHQKTTKETDIQNAYNNTNKKSVSFGAKHNPINIITEEANKVKQYRLWNNIETTITDGHSTGDSFIAIDFDTNQLRDISSPALRVLEELLNRGNSLRSYEEMERIQNQNDFEINFCVGHAGLSAIGIFKDNQAQQVTELIKETLNNPNFSQEEFDRIKSNLKDKIIATSANAYDNLLANIYGDIKSFSTKNEQIKEIDELTLEDIKNLYSKIFTTSHVQATLTAPISENPQLINNFNNQLSVGLPVFKPVDKTENNIYQLYTENNTGKIITEAEDNKQAHILQGYTFKTSQNVDDIAKISILNTILGKGMSSRLFTDLREKEKLAYSVRSSQYNVGDMDTIVLEISTTTESEDPKEGSPENARKALDGFKRNVNLLKNEPVSQKELEAAKVFIKSNLLNKFETNSGKISSFISAIDSPYNTSYYNQLYAAIDKVTAEDIQQTANYVFKNPPVTSIVASQKTLEELKLN